MGRRARHPAHTCLQARQSPLPAACASVSSFSSSWRPGQAVRVQLPCALFCSFRRIASISRTQCKRRFHDNRTTSSGQCVRGNPVAVRSLFLSSTRARDEMPYEEAAQICVSSICPSKRHRLRLGEQAHPYWVCTTSKLPQLHHTKEENHGASVSHMWQHLRKAVWNLHIFSQSRMHCSLLCTWFASCTTVCSVRTTGLRGHSFHHTPQRTPCSDVVARCAAARRRRPSPPALPLAGAGGSWP